MLHSFMAHLTAESMTLNPSYCTITFIPLITSKQIPRGSVLVRGGNSGTQITTLVAVLTALRRSYPIPHCCYRYIRYEESDSLRNGVKCREDPQGYALHKKRLSCQPSAPLVYAYSELTKIYICRRKTTISLGSW